MGGGLVRITVQSFLDDFERYPRLFLHPSQSFRLDVFLQERLDASVQRGAEGTERVAVDVGAIGLRGVGVGVTRGGARAKGSLGHDGTGRFISPEALEGEGEGKCGDRI